MKSTMHLLARFGFLSLLAILSIGSAFAQADIAKAIQEKLNAEAAKLEKSCADDIKKYCSDVTPGEGRMLYCMHAYEDKISPKCGYDLEEAAADVQLSADNLKEAITACKAEISGVCGKTQPGQGRIAACLFANKSTASKACGDVLGKIEAMAAH
jgi:Cysteine rich repeat